MPPNNKKQRGRRNKQKKKEAQNALFGTPAIDEWINELAARSDLSITAKASSSAAAVVSKSSASSSTTQTNDAMVCYHGSKAEHFDAESPSLEMVKSYVSLHKKSYDDVVQLNEASNKFLDDKENQQIICHDEFTNFVFALAVSLYLKVPSEDKEKYHRLQTSGGRAALEGEKMASYELEMILQLGLTLKYHVIPEMIGEKVNEEQFLRYLRDVGTDRGIINRLHRETHNQCDCMKTRKKAANKMDKTVLCEACYKVFPKAETKLCDGCKLVAYCSEECNNTHWPHHKQFCTYEQESVANKRKKNDKTKKNMAAATTGTATSNANGSMSTPTTQSISNPNLGSTSGGGNIGEKFTRGDDY